jgi:cystathionine beta-lyase
MEIVDLAGLAREARQRGVLTIVDNTFASPINQNPLDFGIDVVIHSGTKYLGGHSDLCFGAVLASAELIRRIHRKAIQFGGSINALTCYLIERSLKTLAVRVERQNRNAGVVAEFLAGHDGVARVFYPGLPESQGHAIAERQMHGFGGMLSFELAGNCDCRDFLLKLKMITPALSLGGVESTIVLPSLSSHRLMPQAERETIGISNQLFRLSVGIEEAEDLVADLDQAIHAVAARRTVTA